MNMMMHMFAGNDWCNGVSFFRTCFGAGILKLQTLLLKTSFDGAGIAVLDLTLLDRGHPVRVLFWEDFAIFDRLD